MRRNIFRWLAIALIAFSQWGCMNNTNNDNGPKTQTYDNDGYLGLTNTNPNLPTHPSYHTYGVDVQTIRRAAMKIKGVTGVNVALFGGAANVRLRLAEGIEGKKAERIKEEALKQITYEMPRYPVIVTLD